MSGDDDEENMKTPPRPQSVRDWSADPELSGGVPVPAPAATRRTPVPHHRPKSQWGDDERAAAGSVHRRIGADGLTDSERRRQRNGHTLEDAEIGDQVERELGGPGLASVEEITAPWEILDREDLTPDEADIIRRSRRDSTDPATTGDIAKLLARMIKRQLDERSEQKRQADAVLKLIAHPPNEAVSQLQRQVAAHGADIAELKRTHASHVEVVTTLRREVLMNNEHIGQRDPDTKDGTLWQHAASTKRARRVVAWLAGLALTSAIGSVSFVIASIKTSGGDAVRLERAERDIQQLDQDVRELRHQLERRKDKEP